MFYYKNYNKKNFYFHVLFKMMDFPKYIIACIACMYWCVFLHIHVSSFYIVYFIFIYLNLVFLPIWSLYIICLRLFSVNIALALFNLLLQRLVFSQGHRPHLHLDIPWLHWPWMLMFCMCFLNFTPSKTEVLCSVMTWTSSKYEFLGLCDSWNCVHNGWNLNCVLN